MLLDDPYSFSQELPSLGATKAGKIEAASCNAKIP